MDAPLPRFDHLSRRDLRWILAGALLPAAPGLRAQNAPAPAGPQRVDGRLVRSFRLIAEARDQTFEPTARPSRWLRLVDGFVEPQPGASTAEPAFPLLRARVGERLIIMIGNRIAQSLLLQLRGLRNAPLMDFDERARGLSQEKANPVFAFDADQAGTFLIQPAAPMVAAEQNARGLMALLIVEEAVPPPVDHDLGVLLADGRFDADGALAAGFSAPLDVGRMGRLGNRLIANGAPAPARLVARPNARIRLRLVNGANARAFPLTATNLKAEVIAIDSTPCTPFDPLKRTVTLTPGTRVELMLEAPARAGETGRIEARAGQGLPLLEVTSLGEPLPEREKFAGLPDPGLPPAIRLQDAVRAELVIAGGLPRDGQVPDAAALARLLPDPAKAYRLTAGAAGTLIPGGLAARPLLSARRGQEIVLAINNRTDWPQVIAVHGHSFRLLHPFDDGWEPYWLDSILVAPGTTARIAFHAGQPGRWLIRSAIAEHLAGGVLTSFVVV